MRFFSKKSFFIQISLLVFFANIVSVFIFFLKDDYFLKNFVVKNIYIYGAKYTDLIILKNLIKNVQDQYIGSKKVCDLRDEIYKLPFVKTVKILKKYPDTIIVKITEKKLQYINSDGYFLDENLIKINEKVMGYHNNLVILDGNPSKDMVSNLFKELNKLPLLKKNIVSATLVSNRRWNIVVDIYGQSILFKLPDSSIYTALSNFFKKVYRTNIFSKKISVIDLRSDKTIIFKSKS